MISQVITATSPHNGHNDKIDIARYQISSTNGFVPHRPPLTKLPSVFAKWDDLASRLPILLSQDSNVLRREVSRLPLLPSSDLTQLTELRRAYVVLGFLVHGYVWCGAADHEGSTNIPEQLAQPYFEVCDRLGMKGQETLAYAGLCTWNWGVKDGAYDMEGQQWDIGSMRSLVTFTGTRDEEVFYLVPVMVEREAGPLIARLVELVELIQPEGHGRDSEPALVEEVLLDLKKRLVKMQGLMKLLHEQCDPAVFWGQVRPFLAGGRGGRGWVFELADGSKVTRWCVGGSAAQSATFPLLDAVLGIRHERVAGDVSVFEEMRTYMPVEQRDILSLVEAKRSLGDFVADHAEARGLLDAYNDVLEELAKWRSKHIGVVTTHIVNQARKEKQQNVPAKQITDGLAVKDEGDLQGTGGSALIPFLKGARKDTEAAKK